MSATFSYSAYSADESFVQAYDTYQAHNYMHNPSERDKESLKHLLENAPDSRRIVDYACSTGNFLKHCKKKLPGASLTGIDLAKSSIERAKGNPELVDVEFIQDDMINFRSSMLFDAANATAVFSLFTDDEVHRALMAIRSNLVDGGVLVGFEWLSPWSLQRLEIVETSLWHPQGLKITMRPKEAWSELLTQAGYTTVEYFDFEMPFELERGKFDADVATYTETLHDGRRLSFRGALFQPWCHYVAFAH